MEWTSETPTKDGLYFCIFPNSPKTHLVVVRAKSGYFERVDLAGGMSLFTNSGLQWCGPIEVFAPPPHKHKWRAFKSYALQHAGYSAACDCGAHLTQAEVERILNAEK